MTHILISVKINSQKSGLSPNMIFQNFQQLRAFLEKGIICKETDRFLSYGIQNSFYQAVKEAYPGFVCSMAVHKLPYILRELVSVRLCR